MLTANLTALIHNSTRNTVLIWLSTNPRSVNVAYTFNASGRSGVACVAVA